MTDNRIPLVGGSPNPFSVFQQDWWIKIAGNVYPGNMLQVVDQEKVLGCLPYSLVINKAKQRLLTVPPWTLFNGPIIDPSLPSKTQADILRRLIAQIPRRSSVRLHCDPHLPNADIIRAAFERAGFSAGKRHITYLRLPAENGYVRAETAKKVSRNLADKIGDIDPDIRTLIDGLLRSKRARNNLKRACREIDIIEALSASEFVDFYTNNIMAQGMQCADPPDIARRLIDEGLSNGQVKLVAARAKTAGGDVPYDAALALALDDRRLFYWLSTSRLDSHSDAIKVLAMKAMQIAQSRRLIFDVVGADTEGRKNLYIHLFGLKIEDHREIYERITLSFSLYERYKPALKRTVAFARRAREKARQHLGLV
jgi:hypothetical protein